MEMIGKVDGALMGADDMFNKYLGDGADPKLAPPGQQTMDPMEILASLQTCEITEKASAIEAITALVAGEELEMPNKYNVLDASGKPIFFVLETTDACTRQAKNCVGDCAAFKADMRVINESNEAEEAFKMERPWQCTFCCFNRPKFVMTDAAGNEIATMTDPWACCDMTFTVTTEMGDMYVKGGCCQLGLFCPLPCGPCAEVHFDIEDGDGNNKGSITKQVPSMLKFLAAPDVDNYKLDISGVDNPVERAAVIALAIFIDFRYFSENANKEDSDGDGIPDRFDFQDGEGEGEGEGCGIPGFDDVEIPGFGGGDDE